MPFRFKKNERGYSEFTFKLLRVLLIGSQRALYRPILVNPENMPTTGPCFLFGNHSHYVDPFFINTWMYDEPTAGVMTREQFHKPVSALFMDSVGIVPTTKYVPEPGVIRSVMKMADQNRMIVIFPEGGRRWDGRPKPLIESTLKLFYKMKLPVHPVRLHGAYLNWPRWADFPRFARIQVHFLPPLNPGDFPDYETFAADCKASIHFNEYETPYENCIPKWAYKPASGIHRLLYRCPETGVDGAVNSADGHHVVSAVTGTRYLMNPASRLLDHRNQTHSLLDIYDRMQEIPMLTNKQNYILCETNTPLLKLNHSYQLDNLGIYTATMYTDSISLTDGIQRVEFAMQDILYISIEQNHKISLTLRDGTWQFFVIRGSALQWQHYIRRLQAGHKPVTSL